MEVANPSLDDMAAILQAGHVGELLARRLHESVHALLDVAHEHVVLRKDLLCRSARNSHRRLEHLDLLHQTLVFVVLRHINDWNSQCAHP